MSLVDLIMAAESSRAHRAVRRTAYRHQHVAAKPLVVVAYNLSGEAAAPLGIMYGTRPGEPDRSLSPPSRATATPGSRRSTRSRTTSSTSSTRTSRSRPMPTKAGGFRQVASDAPQIVVPNRATRSYLGARLGRSLRYLGLGDTHDVP